MARDIDDRLRSLNARRQGTDRIAALSSNREVEVLAKSLMPEAYSKRAPTQKHTQYTLGAMQEVAPHYTQITLTDADRVWQQLKRGLSAQSIPVSFRLQGSVSCNIHILRFSDIDLLVLDERYLHYDPNGIKAKAGVYYDPVPYDTLKALMQLRRESESILDDAFRNANVKKSGAKSINVSGGPLSVPVDVVPSNWCDTADYQRTGEEKDRGVHILNKDVPERILNTPFNHIHLINMRDHISSGGLKKAIRLCKNVKADAVEGGTKIELSSFDIASALWHADMKALTVEVANELAILAEATRFFNYLAENTSYAQTLEVPDGSRVIFDSNEKLTGLRLLSLEMSDLLERVISEQFRSLHIKQIPKNILLEAIGKVDIPEK